jgi:IS5 family transposase
MGKKFFAASNEHLKQQGIKVGNGTIVDAAIITAPSSTKNSDKECDPEMHQTKKGSLWYFGMKGHIGVDSKEKIIHSVEVAPANVHDSQTITGLLRGSETKV